MRYVFSIECIPFDQKNVQHIKYGHNIGNDAANTRDVTRELHNVQSYCNLVNPTENNFRYKVSKTL